MRGSNACRHLTQSILIDLGAESFQTIPYAQTFQRLREWAPREFSDIYKMNIHADELPASDHARRYNALEPF